MANTSAPATNFVVATGVYPQHGAQSVLSTQGVIMSPLTSPSGVVPTATSQLAEFFKGQPAALGVVEIMVGVVVLLFGIVTTAYVTSVSVYSGIMFWGAIIYIVAGSLTVRASQELTPCLVESSRGMNISSAITAGISVIMHGADFLLILHYDCNFHPYCQMYKDMYFSRTRGITGVMLVLSLLQCIISVYVAVFACKATYNSNTQVTYVNSQVPSAIPTFNLSTAPLNTSEMPPLPSSVFPPVYNSGVQDLRVGKSEDLPPEYTTA